MCEEEERAKESVTNQDIVRAPERKRGAQRGTEGDAHVKRRASRNHIERHKRESKMERRSHILFTIAHTCPNARRHGGRQKERVIE